MRCTLAGGGGAGSGGGDNRGGELMLPPRGSLVSLHHWQMSSVLLGTSQVASRMTKLW